MKKRTDGTPVSQLGEDTELDKDAFREIIGKIDQGLRALPATAQVSLYKFEFELLLNEADLVAAAACCILCGALCSNWQITVMQTCFYDSPGLDLQT